MNYNNDEEEEEIDNRVTHAIREFYEKKEYLKCISFCK